MSANRTARGVMNKRFGSKSRGRSKPPHVLEVLESRTLLSYTFSLVGQTATVAPVAATGGPILIDEVLVTGNPFLEWSQDNGVTFSIDWDSATPGDQTLPATTASTINLTPTTGAGSSITLGDLVSPASNIFALFHLNPAGDSREQLAHNRRPHEHPCRRNLRLLQHPGLDQRPRGHDGRDQLHVVRADQLLSHRGRSSR